MGALSAAEAMPRQATQLVSALLPVAGGMAPPPNGDGEEREEGGDQERWPFLHVLETSARRPVPFIEALNTSTEEDWETDDGEEGGDDDYIHMYMHDSADDSDDEGEAVTDQQLEECTVTFPIADPSQLGEDNRQCTICQDIFEAGAEVRALPCLHVFHPECIDSWLSRPRSLRRCPSCMTDCVTGTARCAHIAGEKDEAELAEMEDWETVSGSSAGGHEEEEEVTDSACDSIAAESAGYTDTPADTPPNPPADTLPVYSREPVSAISTIPHTQVP